MKIIQTDVANTRGGSSVIPDRLSSHVIHIPETAQATQADVDNLQGGVDSLQGMLPMLSVQDPT